MVWKTITEPPLRTAQLWVGAMNYPGNANVVHPPHHKQLQPDFREVISDYREINASNISALKRAARNIAATYEFGGEKVCDGFYKAALECGLKYWHAQDIHAAIRKMP